MSEMTIWIALPVAVGVAAIIVNYIFAEHRYTQRPAPRQRVTASRAYLEH
jgi:hypothetical protein